MKAFACKSSDRAKQISDSSQISSASTSKLKLALKQQLPGWVGVSTLLLIPATILTTGADALAGSRCQGASYRNTSFRPTRPTSGAVYYNQNYNQNSVRQTSLRQTSSCNSSSDSLRQVGFIDGLQLGSEGSEVFSLQRRLNSLGYTIDVDGVFGSETDQAVRSFQASAGLTPDGVVGPATQQALSSTRPVVFRPQRPVSARPIPCDQSINDDFYCNQSYFPPRPPEPIRPITRNRYVVLIPADSRAQLSDVRQFVRGARLVTDRRGRFIEAASYPDRLPADGLAKELRKAGFDAQVRYF